MASLCTAIDTYRQNPERQIDMVALGFERFHQHGYVIWPESQAVYRTIQAMLPKPASILVAGAGIGWGGALLKADVVTDISARHLTFCRQIYPWLEVAQWDITLCSWPIQHEAVVAVEVLEHVVAQKDALANMIASTTETGRVWLSTPNRRNPSLGQDTPRNPYHVRELIPEEIIEMAADCGATVTIRHWQTGEPLSPSTLVSPLIYEIAHTSSSHSSQRALDSSVCSSSPIETGGGWSIPSNHRLTCQPPI